MSNDLCISRYKTLVFFYQKVENKIIKKKKYSFPRTLGLQMPDSVEYRNGCREINCKITCMDAHRFYDMLYESSSVRISLANMGI